MTTLLILNYVFGLILTMTLIAKFAKDNGGLWHGCSLALILSGSDVKVDTTFKIVFVLLSVLVVPHIAIGMCVYEIFKK